MLLDDKFAIVTGGASARGIGRAIARAFAQQGARVAIADIDGGGAAAAAAELGAGHIGLGMNVADEASSPPPWCGLPPSSAGLMC